MFNRVKKALPQAERPLLATSEYSEIVFEDIKRKKYIRAYYVLFTSVFCILCICAALFLFGKFGHTPSVYEKIVSRLDFLDIVPTKDILVFFEGILIPSKEVVDNGGQETDAPTVPITPPLSFDTLYSFDYLSVPDGETPIIPMDLSLYTYGDTYINNSTGYEPNTVALMSAELGNTNNVIPLAASMAPRILIIHTHGTEGFSVDGAVSYKESNDTEYARTEDLEKNVVAVGRALKDALNKEGIKAIHCEIMHDKDGYRGAYARSEETVRRYLEQYPTIKMVIDLHRDAVIKSNGELVRPVSIIDGKAAAQVMCVVGSSWGGEDCPNWERNLALALQLRRELNGEYERICRPVFLKSSTYNQELAEYSLLLEVGASGNSLEEATRSAQAVAKALANMNF